MQRRIHAQQAAPTKSRRTYPLLHLTARPLQVGCILAGCDARLARHAMLAHLTARPPHGHRKPPEAAKLLLDNCALNRLPALGLRGLGIGVEGLGFGVQSVGFGL